MSPVWGVHTGLQNTTVGELVSPWHHMRAPWDRAGLDHLAGAIDELGR